MQDTDFYWQDVRDKMKSGEDSANNLFGTEADQINAEKCHYVASTYIPELTRPLLYETPAVAGLMLPEDGLYLSPGDRHVRIKMWNIETMVPASTPAHRLMRSNNFLSVVGTRWFLGCKDCNQNHTGDRQLANMVDKMYGVKFTADDSTNHLSNIYTLMFDMMMDNGPMIQVTENRCKTWQIELWINFCAIMLVAQFQNINVKQKYNQSDKIRWDYIFHYAHRDMGICDFYMSQLLASLLYANFDIDCDFMWLHQKFLSVLPVWARRNGFFRCPDEGSYNCLWRMVLSEFEKDEFLPVIREGEYGPGDAGHRLGPYWWDIGNPRLALGTLQTRVLEFNRKWLIPIGYAIDERDLHLDGFSDKRAALENLRNFYRSNANTSLYRALRTMSKTADGHGPNARYNYNGIAADSSLSSIETLVLLFTETPFKLLYQNMILLSFARIHVAYNRIMNLKVPGEEMGLDPTERVKSLQEKCVIKWTSILNLSKHIASRNRRPLPR